VRRLPPGRPPAAPLGAVGLRAPPAGCTPPLPVGS
jgi:hypothetical protein